LLVKYRVDELASRSGTSVDTVRFYQSRGLLPAPERDGRVAWYSDAHVERLARIRALKDQGFTLASIKRLLAGGEDADTILASVVVAGPSGDSRALTLEELAAATGISTTVLQAIEREGLLDPTTVDGRQMYSAADAAIVGAGLELLSAGLPLSELLDLARRHDRAMRTVAEEAVDLFVRFVRDPIHASAATEEDAAARLVAAFNKMLPATTTLVASHFRRVLLSVAARRLEAEGLVVTEDAQG
jgi:DNA-binding transcriptional MerR regulator